MCLFLLKYIVNEPSASVNPHNEWLFNIQFFYLSTLSEYFSEIETKLKFILFYKI